MWWKVINLFSLSVGLFYHWEKKLWCYASLKAYIGQLTSSSSRIFDINSINFGSCVIYQHNEPKGDAI